MILSFYFISKSPKIKKSNDSDVRKILKISTVKKTAE